MSDIHSPAHYTQGSIEPLTAIEDWNLNFRLANVVKYLVRAPHKGTQLKDLEKARFYLDREIQSVREAIPAAGPLAIGDRVLCRHGDDTMELSEGKEYRLASVQNGHEFSFVVLAEMPSRYWDANRFSRVPA